MTKVSLTTVNYRQLKENLLFEPRAAALLIWPVLSAKFAWEPASFIGPCQRSEFSNVHNHLAIDC